FVTREVTDAETADGRWAAILADPDPLHRRVARRALARALGELFRRLHAAGVYHNDLKDVNVLVRGEPHRPECVLLDLEDVRCAAGVARRRRQKNLVQLERTLGRQAAATDRLRFLKAYLGEASLRPERRAWAEAIRRRADAKDGGRPPVVAAAPRPPLSCMIVCQNEETQLGEALESVRWCDEIV